MKWSMLIALLFTAPLAVMAQIPVFTDNFTNGSTNNTASIPGGTATASFTSYDIASTKNASIAFTGIKTNQYMRFTLSATTTSGLIEAQAIFAAGPIALISPGDYINLTFVFTNTSGVLPNPNNSGSYIYMGLFNSGGSLPLAGNLANAGLTTTVGAAFATGNAANWQGYSAGIGGILFPSRLVTRPLQNGTNTTSADQELLANGIGGGTYVNPTGLSFGSNVTNNYVPATGAVFTNSLTIVLTDTNLGILTITNNLYDITGAVVVGQTNQLSGITNVAEAFDALAIGYRCTLSTAGNFIMDISQITVTKSIFGTPGPSFNVTGGGTGCPGGDAFPIGLNGSVTTNAYLLFTNGVFSGQVTNGTGSAISFGPQPVLSAAYTNTVLASNTVSGATGFMTGDPIIAPFAPPVITSGPASVVLASGFPAVFKVTATGGGLGYQWYTNGVKLATNGVNILNTQTNTLTISPATSADVHTTSDGYSVVITNRCGLAVTSSVVALTIDTPANLVWQGGNPNTNWDLATTANWTAGSGPVVFNSGDNVTFDDSSIWPLVTLVGNNLAPTLLTESASQNYTFTGSGAITGPGALLKSGSGTLIISNANSYTGTTTISGGGTLIARNNQALGNGPLITLAGGKFEAGQVGSATVGWTNINVTTDSTIQNDVGSTFGLVILGTLNGTPGATLTFASGVPISSSSTTPERIRLYGAFTNSLNIVIAGNATANEIELAPYLPAGNQVYNGAISGVEGRFTMRGTGTAILNGTNTFNDSGVSANGNGPSGYSVLLSSGNVGVGIDSVSSSPPTIDSSPLGTGMLGIQVGAEGGTSRLFASGGAHTVANPVGYTSTTNTVTFILGGTNMLTLSGEFSLSRAADSANNATNRTLQVTNTALTVLSGVVDDPAGTGCGLIKTGNGVLALNGTNTYTGPTIITNGTLLVNGSIVSTNVLINAGTLGGSGIINSAVTNLAGGTLAPGAGTNVAGTVLTINSNLTLLGNTIIKVSHSNQTNDTVVSSGTIAYGGTLTMATSGGDTAFVLGNTYHLFTTAGGYNGNFASIQPGPGPGLGWSNDVANRGNFIVVVSTEVAPVPGFSGTPTNIFVTQTVVFTNTSTGDITNSAWTFGDGNVTNLSGANVTNNVSHVYSNAGPDTVSLTVSGNGGSSNLTQIAYITVKPKVSIGQPVLSGGNLILSGTNGPANQPYRILSSTNVALPLAGWLPVYTNVFATDGSYLYTNTPLTNTARFFILVSP